MIYKQAIPWQYYIIEEVHDGHGGPPLPGIYVHPDGPEGGTGPLGRDWKTSLELFNRIK